MNHRKNKQESVVLMLYGGRSFEHDVSVITAIQIEEMWRNDHKLLPLYMREGSLYAVRDWRRFASYTQGKIEGKRYEFCLGGVRCGARTVPVERALLLTHGGEGEDGTLQGVLRYYAIPYTSCGVESSALCMDKWLCKQVLRSAGFPVVHGELASVDHCPDLPCIVKPARLGSSLGIHVVREPSEWGDAFAQAASFDQCVLAERYLEGAKEYTCAAVQTNEGVLVSEVECPCHGTEPYSFDQKYRHECMHQLPAEIERDLYCQIQAMTKDIYAALHLKGVVRVDFLEQNGLFVNEINTIPGSLAYRLFAAGGTALSRLLQHLLSQASYEPFPSCANGALLAELVGNWK